MNFNRTTALLQISFLCGLSLILTSAKGADPGSMVRASQLNMPSKEFLFEENKGQLMDYNHNPVTDIRYYGHSAGVNVYFRSNTISFVYTKTESDNSISEATGIPEGNDSPFTKGAGGFDPRTTNNQQPATISTSRMDLVLVGSNPKSEIIASDRQEYFENFFTTGDADHGI